MLPLVLLIAGVGALSLAAPEPSAADGDAGPEPPPPPPAAPQPGPPAPSGESGGTLPPPPSSSLSSRLTLSPSVTETLQRRPVLRLPGHSTRAPSLSPEHGHTFREPQRLAPPKPRYVVEPGFAAHLVKRAAEAVGSGPLHEQGLRELRIASDLGDPKRMFEVGRYWLIEASIYGIDHGLNHMVEPDTRWSPQWIDEVLSLATACLIEPDLNPGLTEAERYAQTRKAIKKVLERPQDCWTKIDGTRRPDLRYYRHFEKAYRKNSKKSDLEKALGAIASAAVGGLYLAILAEVLPLLKSGKGTFSKALCRQQMRALRAEEDAMRAHGSSPPLRVLGRYFYRFAFLRRVTWVD